MAYLHHKDLSHKCKTLCWKLMPHNFLYWNGYTNLCKTKTGSFVAFYCSSLYSYFSTQSLLWFTHSCPCSGIFHHNTIVHLDETTTEHHLDIIKDEKLHLPGCSISSERRWKSDDTKWGLYLGWCKTVKTKCWIFAVVLTLVCSWALSPWKRGCSI
jgi:hypothetical protein